MKKFMNIISYGDEIDEISLQDVLSGWDNFDYKMIKCYVSSRLMETNEGDNLPSYYYERNTYFKFNTNYI